MHPDTRKYNGSQAPTDQEICDLLAQEIDRHLPEAENRIWHAHPVSGSWMETRSSGTAG